MRNIPRIAKEALGYLPDDGILVKLAARKLILQKELFFSRIYRSAEEQSLPDPRAVYWLDPMRVEFHTSLRTESEDWEDWVFAQRGRIRSIRNGDWDRSDLRVADMRVCRAVESRISNACAWNSTDYYQTALRQIEAGRVVWCCRDRSDLDRHCVKVDNLIESISRNGYHKSSELEGSRGIDSSFGQQEILINVSREGYPIFQDGRHRLAIARALKVPSIPVQILVRHQEWYQFRIFMQRMASGEGGGARRGFLYQRPIHFDLDDIPFEHGCADRWNAMSENLPPGGGLVLDIGCNLGYFCHQLAIKGYSPIGVEKLPDIGYAAKKIMQAERMNVKLIIGDIFAEETRQAIGNNFEIVVAVNIFHHFLKTEDGFNKLEQFMKNLHCEKMFFEPHLPDEPQMQGSYRNLSPEDFVRQICDWGRFASSAPIYTATDGRTVYALDR